MEDPSKNYLRALAATTLLISWILCINMVARNPQFPKQNVHMAMFFKVTRKFIKLFVIFTPYIIAFGLFFYISIAKDFEEVSKDVDNNANGKTNINGNDKTNINITREMLYKHIENNGEFNNETKHEVLTEIDKKGEFFDKVGFSVLKSLTMFVGELEFSDIPFNSIPYFSHIFFVIFVFFIVIVLMNLLTGIAVDEISEIQKNGEVSSQVVRVNAVWQMEKFYSLCGFCPLSWCTSEKVEGKKNKNESRSEKVEEEEEKWSSVVKVNDPCECMLVCTCGSKNYWRTKLLIAVKKREQEEQERIEQELEQMKIIKRAIKEDREEQEKREKEQMEIIKRAIREDREEQERRSMQGTRKKERRNRWKSSREL